MAIKIEKDPYLSKCQERNAVSERVIIVECRQGAEMVSREKKQLVS
jgi:hypothetical protein